MIKTKSDKDLNLEKLIEDLKNQVKIKKDFVIPSAHFDMKNGELRIFNDDDKANKALADLLAGTGISVPHDLQEKGHHICLTPLDVCHTHIAEKLGIPKRYYDKMMSKDDVKLFDHNASHWFKRGGEKNYLIRTFIDPDKGEGVARALLSNRFFTIDNYDFLFACLEAIKRSGIDPKILKVYGEITEKKFYARFWMPSIEVKAPNLLKQYRALDKDGLGKTGVVSGFVVSNSEVGHGQFSISPRAVILACHNGYTFAEDAFQKKHLGAELDEYSEITWSDETKEKNKELIISQIKDRIRQYMSKEYLSAKINKLERLASKEIQHPFDTVKNVCASFDMSEEKEKSILEYFMKGADMSPFGVAQALTYYAHKNADADERYDLEAEATVVMEKINDFDKPFIRSEKTQQLEMTHIPN